MRFKSSILEIGGRPRFDRSDTRDVAERGDAEGFEDQLGERAGRDPHRGLAGRGTFEHVANIVEVVFEHAGQIGMAGARPRHRFGLAAVGGIDRHPLLPVFEIAILDDQRDRTAHRAPEADARDHAHLVALDRHPSAPSVALLAAREVVVDLREIDIEAGRVAFHHRDQFGAVRFTGCQETQHLGTVHQQAAARRACANRFNQSWRGGESRSA